MVVQRHKQNHLIIFKNVVSITKTVEHRFQNHSKQVTGGILPDAVKNEPIYPKTTTKPRLQMQMQNYKNQDLWGHQFVVFREKCYNGNFKRKNTDVSTCFTFSSSCPFLTSWRLEEYRRNYTYDCEDYDCHVQPEQQRCAHPVKKTQQQNMTVFLEAKLPCLNCDWVKQSLKSTD